ncbi:MAG: hypothetical protein IPP90_09375 [Gemmatimonadaceae bacterium]|nr:hypothetical protein [Gemmatimonadaceae bacterium]
MKTTFDTMVAGLQRVYSRFDADAIADTREYVRRLQRTPLRGTATLSEYHECLLFLRAHPSDADMVRLVDASLTRLATFLRKRRSGHAEAPDSVGLPFVSQVTRFSHDCVRWLSRHPHCAVRFEEFAEATLDLNAVLRLTLTTLERSETNAELSNDALLDVLGVRPDRRLAFLLAELSRLDGSPYIKDQLYDALGVMVRVTPTHVDFSAAFNRLPGSTPFYQSERIRQFDAAALIDRTLPSARRLNTAAREHVVRVIRNTMTLTSRETDPATYLDARSLRVFDLDRGVSVAIYGMTHDRQLALESYVGFTAFRNGMPVSYGGAWMLGERADFGMNIFEPYRGGESGYLMCQLLRVYHRMFDVRYFEVDAHQFGLDNPEGIDTGAFWFYYRYGFRPVDPALAVLARREKSRLAAKPLARSTRKTLLALTGSSVALSFGGRAPISLYQITTRVTRMVQRHFGGDRPAAERECVSRFLAASGRSRPRDPDQRAALVELAMVAGALRVTDAAGVRLLAEMVEAKPVDVYRYQRLLSAFLSTPRVASSRQ